MGEQNAMKQIGNGFNGEQYLLSLGFNTGEIRMLKAGAEGERTQSFLATGQQYSTVRKIKAAFPMLASKNLLDVDTLRYTGIVRLTDWGSELANEIHF
jgi:hypothetical protein